MATRAANPPLWMLALSLLTGAGLFCAPSDIADRIRATVRDALQPGQAVTYRVREWTSQKYATVHSSWNALQGTPGEPIADNHASEQVHALQAENAWLREQLRTAKTAAATVHATEPLVVPDLVESRVLGEETLQRLQQSYRRILGSGERNGIESAALVVADRSRQIDLGNDWQVQADQLVLAGRAVVGKVSQVGKFTSTLMPITDKQYRGLARMARSTGDGVEFGAEGILEGDGSEICRLNFIQSTEPVSVGDRIYTAAADGGLRAPLLYGTVVEAELPTGAPHWTIRVKPAADLSKLRIVQVLRTRPNPLRLNAH